MNFTETATVQTPARKRKRVFWWVFLGIQILFLVWVIAGAAFRESQRRVRA